MKICLAGYESQLCLPSNDFSLCNYALQSVYTVSDKTMELMRSCSFLLIDSGAFTFMNNTKKGENVNFDEYVDRYIEFIKRWDIQYFFELDIDVVVGIQEVERLRKKLEEGTGKKCIPVWHKSRGKDYFIDMCKNYDYVAIGGIVTKEIRPTDYDYFPWFIDTAHQYGTQIHGLGLTGMKAIEKYHFDSVDSTNWVGGGRFGNIFRFNGRFVSQHTFGNGKLKDELHYKEVNTHNFVEWCKFQKYADIHL